MIGVFTSKCLGAGASLAFLSSVALGQEQPLRVLSIRMPWGPPQALVVAFDQPVAPDRWPGLGPVTLLPLTMYIQEPSALKVMSCGS